MGEAIDDAIADEGDEEESEAIVAQVYIIYILSTFVIYFKAYFTFYMRTCKGYTLYHRCASLYSLN